MPINPSSSVQFSVAKADNSRVILRAGFTGETGQNGVMSNGDVISIIDLHVTSTPSTDGILVDNGNVSITIDSLAMLP